MIDPELLLKRLEDEIEPRLSVDDDKGGYNCCGCLTVAAVYDDIVELIKAMCDEKGKGE